MLSLFITFSLATCYSIEVTGAEGSPVIENITEDGVDKWKITLKWKDEAVNGQITVKRNSADTTCKTQTPEFKDFTIPILSVNGMKPWLTGDLTVVAGKKVEVEYEADLNYIVYGDQDPISFEVDYFEWKKPNGWNFIGANQNAKKIKFLTDLCTEGDIEVRGRSKCGRWSDWEKIFVSRYAKAPCPLTSTATYVICEDKTAISFTATPDNTLTGYTYEWEKPAAWIWEVIPGSGSTAASVRPDGLSGGTVRIRSIACGKKSDWCTVSLPLKTIHPDTKILGTDTLCTEGYQTLSIPPPPSSTITWQITPSQPFQPYDSGSGDFANLILNSATFGDFVTIKFKITTLCGVDSLSKTFFAGKPKLYDMKIDGVPGTQAFVCPGTHTASLKLGGANSACAAWENSGNNPYFFGCLEANAYISGFNGSTAFIARASNVCGSNDVRFFMMPKTWGCDYKEWGLLMYPNPAADQVTIETKLEEGSPLTEKPKMNGIRLISNMGNIVYESFQVSDNFTINLGGVTPGTYTLQTVVEGVTVSETVQIKLK